MIAASLLALALTFGFGHQTASAETFLVNSPDDAVDAAPGDGRCLTKAQGCTLRAAVMEANALPGHDVIRLRAEHYRLTIPGRREDAAATGDLDVTENLTIEGAGFDRPGAQTIVDGNRLDRVFDVPEGRALVLLDMIVQGGEETDGVGGGGIQSRGVLSLTRVRVVGNQTAASGGGILSWGVLALQSTVIDGNRAEVNHGGGLAQYGGQARIENVTISGNDVGAFGGGIWAVEGANMTLHGVTLSNNAARRQGGGLHVNGATVNATNVTFSGNSATQGGGLANIFIFGSDPAPIRLLNVTFFGNRAVDGGAIFAHESPVLIRNSIVARSLGNARNCVGPVTSEGFNIDSRESCGFTAPGDLMTTDPRLSALRDNGGPTRTHSPLRHSPAIDSADNTTCPPVDQRGVPRPVDGDGDRRAVCDRGAVEVSRRAQ